MSKILLKHIPTGTKLPLVSLRQGLTRFKIARPRMFGTEQYEYTYSQLLQHPDWVLEDWDYSQRLSFSELRILENLVARDMLQQGITYSSLHIKIKSMLSSEYARVIQEQKYDELVDGSEDLL